MGIDIEYKKARLYDFCTLQLEETKEIIEVKSYKDISKSDDLKSYYVTINNDINIILDWETRADLLDDLCK